MDNGLIFPYRLRWQWSDAGGYASDRLEMVVQARRVKDRQIRPSQSPRRYESMILRMIGFRRCLAAKKNFVLCIQRKASVP